MSRTFFLNLLFIINYMCRSALRFSPPADVSHTSVIGINRVNVGGLFRSSHPHNISSSNWIRAPEKQFLAHKGKKDEVAAARVWTKLLQLGFPRKFD